MSRAGGARRGAALALLLVMAACGNGSPEPTAEAAPDFSLELGSGGTFTLSGETRPVFLVFWAEW